MKTPKHLFSAHDIAAAIGRNFNATMKFLAEHNIKPVREIRTNSMTYRQYSKSAMNEAISIADKTLTRRKKSDPVQAPLQFEPKDAERIPPCAEPPTPEIAPDIKAQFGFMELRTEIELGQADMLAVLRSIDEKLGRLLAVWEK